MGDEAAPPHTIEAFRHGYEEESRLRGFRSGCGFVTATWLLVCPRCGARDLLEAELGRTGRLVAFTVQTVPSDEFLNDAPYAYVVVDLNGGGRVTGWMAGIAQESELTVGAPVRFAPSYKPGVQFVRAPTEGAPG
ncbi:MAG TPA: OB-fold domain-containing protein [Thermoplasmata archaeon]|jgi:uncharacterized OB-fold protein|nr:OB-fold domain-containing protein [Thermoplasmata archaeon]